MKATSMMVPLLAGNLPLITQCCPCRYRLYPRSKIKMLMPKKAVPSGLPRRRSVSACRVSPSSVVFSRKSCVMAMPIEANASDVRSHARNVRSAREKKRPRSASQPESKKKKATTGDGKPRRQHT